MPEPRRRSRSLLAVLVLVSLILITVDYRQGDGGAVSALQRGALTVFGPVAEGFSTVVRPVTGAFGAIGDLGSLRDQKAALERDNAELRRAQLATADLRREVEQLRAQLNMREKLDYTTTGARVIAQPPSSIERSVMLDVGADNGLLPGMAVMNEFGLVGKLTEVTSSNARVELLTSPSAKYNVRISETAELGFLTGSGANPFQLEVLDPEADVQADTQVVTQASTGSSIPDGIPVGVIDARRGPATRFLSVRPYVDFTKLSIVQVVLDYPRHPVELPEEQRVPAPKRPQPDTDADKASPNGGKNKNKNNNNQDEG